MAEITLDSCGPLAPAQVLALLRAGRSSLLSVIAVEFEMPEFGVGHQRAVDEQTRSDARAEGEHHHHP